MKAPQATLLLAAGTLATLALMPAHKPDDNGTKPKKRSVTFAKDVAPIIYDKCATCHHTGEVAPFNLMSYADAKDKAKTIAEATGEKFMPPWQAKSHGEFANERILTSDEIQTLKDWADQGAPEGDPSAVPPAPKFKSGWKMGQPDFVGKPSESYTVAAEGDDEYRCFVLPTNFDTGRFVTGVDVRPGNHKIVHHVILYVDTNGVAKKLEGKDGKPGYASFGGPGFAPTGALGGWVPGLDPQDAAKGTGIWLPKGADIVMQVHYHRDGKAETDDTQVGLYFNKAPVDKRIRFGSLDNLMINIPAGDSHYEVKAAMTVPSNITVFDVIPHMHWLGHDMTVVATFPDGKKETLVDVQGYDFNWQTRYTYKKPVELPKGTRLNLVAHYDNSTANIHNPNNPPKRVTFGEQTTDEMCFAFFNYTVDAEHLTKGKASSAEDLDSDSVQGIVDMIFSNFDKDGDGKLNLEELTDVIKFFQGTSKAAGGVDPATAAKFVMSMFDKDHDGKLSREEVMAMIKSNQRSGKN